MSKEAALRRLEKKVSLDPKYLGIVSPRHTSKALSKWRFQEGRIPGHGVPYFYNANFSDEWLTSEEADRAGFKGYDEGTYQRTVWYEI